MLKIVNINRRAYREENNTPIVVLKYEWLVVWQMVLVVTTVVLRFFYSNFKTTPIFVHLEIER